MHEALGSGPSGRSSSSGEHRGAAIAAKVATIRACAADMQLDPIEFRHVLDSLDDDCLVKLGLNAFLVNYLAAFASSRPVEEIRKVARQAVREKIFRGWEYRRYLAHLGPQADEPRLLHRAAAETVRSYVGSGRSVIFCTFQFGDCRYGASDIANIGLPMSLAVDAESAVQYGQFRRANPDAFLWRYLRVVNVEDRAGSVALARTLARKGAVSVVVDGNSGADGPMGESSRLEINFLGCRAMVKTGAARLAARFGCPLIPILAPKVDGQICCEIWPALDPGRRLSGGDADRFVEDAMTELYGRFETLVTRYPGQWTVGDRFHRWRQPETIPLLPAEDAEDLVETALAEGKSLTLDEGRILVLDETADLVCTDVRTLRSIRVPPHMRLLADQLSICGGGLSRNWLDRQPTETKAKSLAFVAMLVARNALRIAETRDSGVFALQEQERR